MPSIPKIHAGQLLLQKFPEPGFEFSHTRVIFTQRVILLPNGSMDVTPS